MVDLNETFDPTSVPEDDRNFEPIPAGTYRLQVIESVVAPTKNETGEMLTLTLEVIGGEYEGRRIWDRLNIRNQNPDAQRIAQRALADLCLLVGVSALRDTEQLHHKPFTARVTVQPDKSGQYGPQNRVRYSTPKNQPASNATAGSGGGARPAATQQGKPAGGGTRPWNSNQPRQQRDMDDEIPF